ncbi:MAG: glycosyltransferase, partial [Bdellovibrionales bacterium]|nr:glycosyltransferase [Bdellovibrionales bacterium]
MSLPSFSVVTVSFNQGEFIRDNIESVLAQDYPHVEHIIVDGGSTDQTLQILQEYPHLKWTSEPDRGQTHALEKGFRRATGD